MGNKWKKGAQSPVLFFIDDLANKWVDMNNDRKIQQEEDWGYAGFDENGVFHFLEKEILSELEKIKHGDVTQAELDKVKINTKAEFIYSLESSSSVAGL